MKKILAIIILLCMAALPLFAQLGPGLGVGGWARYVFSPIGGEGVFGEGLDKDNLYVYTQSRASSNFPQKGKIGLATWGNSDFVGFNFDFAYQNNLLEVGDQAQIWVRLHDTLMLHAGKIQGNALRGKIAGGQLINMEEEDHLFFRFYPQFGILADYTPNDNIYIGASIDAGNTSKIKASDVYGWDSVSNTAGYQIGAGYMFSIGHLRAQFIHLNSGDINSALYASGKPLQVAFAYTDIYNLTVELSGRYPLRTTHSSIYSASIAAEYSYERISAMGRFTFMGFPHPDAPEEFCIKAGSVIKYAINFPLFLGLEFSYAADNPLTNVIDDVLQVAPYLGFRYGRGEFRIGLLWQQGLKDDNPNYVFEIPLLFEARFF